MARVHRVTGLAVKETGASAAAMPLHVREAPQVTLVQYVLQQVPLQ